MAETVIYPPTSTYNILDSNVTQYSTPADTTAHDAMTYSLPANTLNADGKILRITAFGGLGATANGKTIKMFFGSTQIAIKVTSLNNYKWHMTGIVVRTGATTQICNTISSFSNTMIDSGFSTTEDETGEIIIKITAKNSIAAAGDIIVDTMFVESLN